MKIQSKVATAVLLALSVLAPKIATANSVSVSDSKAIATQEYKQDLADRTQNEVARVAAALRAVYSENMGTWPGSLADIIGEYYSGDFQTPVGIITGAQNGQNYILTIATSNQDANTLAMLESMANRNHGQLSGATLSFTVEAGEDAAVMQTTLSRFADPSGELNKMYVDLDVNNNNLDSIKSFDATTMVATTAVLTDANISDATIDTVQTTGVATITTDNVTNLTSSTATIGNATIANGLIVSNSTQVNSVLTANAGINVNGVTIVDSNGVLYSQGQDLDTRLLGINDVAYDSNQLGGVDASVFARKDISNYFTQHQYFNAGLDATTINATNLVSSGDINVAGNVEGQNAELTNMKVGDTWVTNTKSTSITNRNEIDELKTRVNGIQQLARWVPIGGTGSRDTTYKSNTVVANYSLCNQQGLVVYDTYSWKEEVTTCWSGMSDNGGGCKTQTVTKYRYPRLRCQ